MSKTYFVATKHGVYPYLRYEPDATIIDPWRYIPHDRARKVIRIGENKPELISILVPSRGRPEWLKKTLKTAFETAIHQKRIEVVAYLDDDDPAKLEYETDVPFILPSRIRGQLRFYKGERRLLSECWNRCADVAEGEILMHCGDDITFDTPGWDQMVRNAFAEIPDRIGLVFGDDLSPNSGILATHGFVHRRWVETVGYFLPPLFSSDWNDVWLSEVAQQIDRFIFLPEMITQHHHYTFGKNERDQTHAEREERGERDDVVGLFKRTAPERKADARKLKAVMAA